MKFKSLTRKPSYSSFFLCLMDWFQKRNFWKKSLSPFRVRKDQKVISKAAEAKVWISSNFYKFLFRNFVVLGFEVVWPRQPHQPQKGLRIFFQKLHFWNQCVPTKKMRYIKALSEKFSLNLSTEEVCKLSNNRRSVWKEWLCGKIVFIPRTEIIGTDYVSAFRTLKNWKSSILIFYFYMIL